MDGLRSGHSISGAVPDLQSDRRLAEHTPDPASATSKFSDSNCNLWVTAAPWSTEAFPMFESVLGIHPPPAIAGDFASGRTASIYCFTSLLAALGSPA